MIELQKLLVDADIDTLKDLCMKAIEREIGEYSTHELRKIAAKMCIPYYAKYSKPELLSVILREKSNVQAA